jgi:hypothetical protein
MRIAAKMANLHVNVSFHIPQPEKRKAPEGAFDFGFMDREFSRSYRSDENNGIAYLIS